MLKFKIFSLTLVFFLSLAQVFAQSKEEAETKEEDIEEVQKLSVGVTFDYLKLHTLLLEESEKWEAALNLRVLESVSVIGEYGIAELRPNEAYKNANYLSEGKYYRVGIDYHLTVTPNNFLLLGLRYSQSSFNENISYEVENPIFPNETGNFNRDNLNATWYEFVLSSEKRVQRMFKRDIPDFLAIGFKFRLKSLQEYNEFDDFDIKNIPGYGRTNIKLNPEFNLYLKFIIPVF